MSGEREDTGTISWREYVEGGGLTPEQEELIVDALCQFPEFIVEAAASSEEGGAC